MVFALLMAITTALVLMGLRHYPWLLATMMGLAFGVLAYTGWGTVVQLRRIYDQRSDRGSEAHGNKPRERSRRR
jgi:threonine/homoserine/homoserine lactone efflux protein